MIRVRFAPSPTGHLHIGGLRAALFNYYFAKKNNGKFLIRIEDTDIERNKQEYTDAILNAFKWANINSDEKIIYQSERCEIYKSYIDILLKNGSAYFCNELNDKNELTEVIKCRVNKINSHISFNDIIRGEISFPISEIDDFIIVRSDGMPLYNLVVVIDDIEMKITHIIRGEEHLSNTPKQLILYQGFQIEPPLFAHLPLILGSDRKKLSKRDAATSVMDYEKEGFLAEALCMYLTRLGWSYKDQEIFTYEEILKYFNLEDIHHSGAIFDKQKLLSINSLFIKNYSIDELYKILKKWNQLFFLTDNKKRDLKIIQLYQPRSNLLSDFHNAIMGITRKPYWNNDYISIDTPKENILNIIKTVKKAIENSDTSYDLLFKNESFKEYPKAHLYKSLRYAMLGVIESPSITDIMNIIGREEVLERINSFLIFLS